MLVSAVPTHVCAADLMSSGCGAARSACGAGAPL